MKKKIQLKNINIYLKQKQSNEELKKVIQKHSKYSCKFEILFQKKKKQKFQFLLFK